MASPPATPPQPATPSAGRVFKRFDIHQRLQHWILIGSFIMLMLTGWPLRMAGEGSSSAIVSFFGGLHACGLVHRVSAVALMVSAAYHVVYLLALWRRRKLAASMLLSRKDVRDIRDDIRYFFGRRREPASFGRYSYFEKFEYWAVVWGTFIMITTGLMLWFPVAATSILPAWALIVSMVAHSNEALLAGLAIFIWHFYNVFLRRAVFPMSWVWLTGNITEDELKQGHREEYDKLQKTASEAKRDEPS